jgi:hypothetical protein
MKVEGPSGSKGVSSSKKAGSVSSADGSFEDFIAQAPKGAQGAAPTRSIARVDALLAVQGAETATERAARRRMHERGDDILKELDRLRMGILTGNLTLGQVIDIADVVASHREKINDPRLTAVLDEIDMRAQIELAKLAKAMAPVSV